MNSARFLRTVAYTPMSQLMRRMGLIIKRRVLVHVAKIYPPLRVVVYKSPPTVSEQPLPVFQDFGGSPVVQRKDGWQFTFLNQTRSLSSQVEWHLAELNEGTRLWKLHLHYFNWTQTLSDEHFVEIVGKWIDNNPPYRDRYWMDSWNSYAISIRVVSWMGEMAIRKLRLKQEVINKVDDSIYRQIVFLKGNLEHDIGGNHIIKNIKALYWASRYFNGESAKLMQKLGNQLLYTELDRQILSDGFHFELSPSYHIQVFTDLLDVWRLIDNCRLKAHLNHRLVDMAQVVADMTHPDGMPALFNDGGLTMSHSPAQALEHYSNITGTDKPVGRQFGGYADAGYYFYRGNVYTLFFDGGHVGPDGLPAHSHGDIFSLEISLGKDRFIVDAGVYEYNDGDRRLRSRASAMHNTLTISDYDQCEFWSSFRMGRRANVKLQSVDITSAALKVEGEHDGYRFLKGSPVHKRLITAEWNGIVRIEDTVTGGSGQDVKARFLLHPEVLIESYEPIRLRRGSKIMEIFVNRGTVSVRPSVWWPDFGVELNTSMLVIELGPSPALASYELRMYSPEVET